MQAAATNKSEGKGTEVSAREMARLALVAAKKKAEDEGRPFDETEFIIQLVESKRKEYERAKQRSQQSEETTPASATPPTASPSFPPAATVTPSSTIQNDETESVEETYTDNRSEKSVKIDEEDEDDDEDEEQEQQQTEEEEEEEKEVNEENSDEYKDADESQSDSQQASREGEEQEEEEEERNEEEEEESEEESEEEEEEEEEEEDPQPSVQDKLSPDIGNRIRQALLTAKEKSVGANKPFDEATAILIAQEMLARAAKLTSTSSSTNSADGKTALSDVGLQSPSGEKDSYGNMIEKVRKPVSVEDQMVLAVIAARKKAEEDGKPFFEEEFTKNYLRKKKKEAEDAKFAKVGAKAKLHFGGESDGFFRDQAVVAAKEARRQAIEEGKEFDEDDFMVHFILTKRREAAMARGVVIPSDRENSMKSETALSLEERRSALLAAVYKEHPTSASRNIDVYNEPVGEVPSPPRKPVPEPESEPLPVSTGPKRPKSNRSVMRFYEQKNIADEEAEKKQLAVESTRKAVSEELKVIEQLLTGESSSAEDSNQPSGGMTNITTENDHHHANEKKEKRNLFEIMAAKRAKEDEEEAERVAQEKVREAEREAAVAAAREEAARKKAELEAKKKHAEQAHKLALARDQARFNIMLARRKAAADGVPFDEEAYLAAEAVKAKDSAIVAMLEDHKKTETPPPPPPEPEPEPEPVPEIPVVKPKVKTGLVKPTKRSGVVPRTGVVLKEPMSPTSPITGSIISVMNEVDTKVPTSPRETEIVVVDERKEQIERARKLASEKQKEMLKMKGNPNAANLSSNRKANLVALTRAEAVARAREMARSKGRTVSTVGKDSESRHGHDDSRHNADGHKSKDDETDAGMSMISKTNHSIDESHTTNQTTSKIEREASTTETEQSDAAESQTATEPNSELNKSLDEELEDTLLLELNDEAEKMKADEAERQREIEELKRLKAKERAPRKTKKKPATFWDTLFMCTPKEGDTK